MQTPILYINACVRKASRTKDLAEQLLKNVDRPYDEIRLESLTFPKVDEAYLDKRDQLIAAGDFQNPMFDLARQFAEAAVIVIAAPFWDLSFPAMLKQYLELVNVVGITFKYSEEGAPVGLCKADKLFYVTTAGGYYVPEEFGFGYVRALAQSYYGIQDVRKVEAAGLDIVGADVEGIMRAAKDSLEAWEITGGPDNVRSL